MQGYFNYIIYGNKEEIKQIAKRMNELAETDNDFRYLNQCFFDGEFKLELTFYLAQYYESPSWEEKYNEVVNKFIEENPNFFKENKGKDLDYKKYIQNPYLSYDDEYYEEDEGEYKNCSISFGMGDGGSGRINDVPFLFEDMMVKLCKEFKDYKIDGEGWLLDFPPYESWHSKRGSEDFNYEYAKMQSYSEVQREDILDENGKFVATEVPIYCECCQDDTMLKIKKKKRTSSKKSEFLSYHCEGECSECHFDHETEIEVISN